MIAILSKKTGSVEYLCNDLDELGVIRDCVYYGIENLYEREVRSLRHLKEIMSEARDAIAMSGEELQVVS